MHWEWSRHLAPGYPEHPPLIAWSIALSTGLFGTAEWSVRLVSVVAATGLFWVAFRLGRGLFDARAALLGVVPLMLAPLFNAGGVLATTDSLLAFFWLLSVYAIKKAVLDGRRAAWLLVGVAVGLCLLSKLPALLLFPAMALFLVATREGRVWLGRWEPWAAALVAILLFLPPLVWNARHDWFTIAMRVGHQSAQGFTLTYLAELIGAQTLIVTPLLFAWVMWGLWSCWRGRSDPRAVLLGIYTVVPLLFYATYSLFARAGIHWPAVGYPAGFLAAGAFTAAAARPRRARAFLLVACLPAVLVTGLLYLVPLVPERVVSLTWSYALRPGKVNTKQLDNIFDWRPAGELVQQFLDEDPENSFVLCRDGYALAGSIAFYTPRRPPVFLWKLQKRNGAAYDMWRAETDLRGRDAVIVEEWWNQEWFDELSCCFDSFSEPRHVEIVRGDRVIREFYVFRATNFAGFAETTEASGP